MELSELLLGKLLDHAGTKMASLVDLKILLKMIVKGNDTGA